MIRELKIIFGLHAVTRQLGIARHALVFFEQLGGIAALAIVLPVARLSAAEVPSPALPTTAASAAALTIVDQIHRPYAVSLAPLVFGQAGLRQSAASDPLVPVCAAKRLTNGRLRRGLERERSAVDLERPGPGH